MSRRISLPFLAPLHSVAGPTYSSSMARRAMQSPVTLNGHCLFSLDLPSLKRARWSFFRTSKTIFKRILQNLVQIDYDNENYEYNDGNGDTIDDNDNENDQKHTNTLGF